MLNDLKLIAHFCYLSNTSGSEQLFVFNIYVRHNICETRGDDFQEECDMYVNDDHENESTASAATPADSTAQEIRQALTVLINERV